jgi:hypothetical protein
MENVVRGDEETGSLTYEILLGLWVGEFRKSLPMT